MSQTKLSWIANPYKIYIITDDGWQHSSTDTTADLLFGTLSISQKIIRNPKIKAHINLITVNFENKPIQDTLFQDIPSAIKAAESWFETYRNKFFNDFKDRPNIEAPANEVEDKSNGAINFGR